MGTVELVPGVSIIKATRALASLDCRYDVFAGTPYLQARGTLMQFLTQKPHRLRMHGTRSPELFHGNEAKYIRRERSCKHTPRCQSHPMEDLVGEVQPYSYTLLNTFSAGLDPVARRHSGVHACLEDATGYTILRQDYRMLSRKLSRSMHPCTEKDEGEQRTPNLVLAAIDAECSICTNWPRKSSTTQSPLKIDWCQS